MKKTIFFFLGCMLSLHMTAQNNIVKIKEIIEKQMTDFKAILNYLNYEDETERMDAGDANDFLGGDYFKYNGSNYPDLGSWIEKFYLKTLGQHEIEHKITIDNTSLVKLSDDPVELLYKFDATLNRTNISSTDDFLLKDQKVSFVVMVEKERGIRILGIDGAWNIQPVRPEYFWEYTLVPSDNSIYMDEYGGEQTVSFKSLAQKKKRYANLKTTDVDGPVRVEFDYESNNNVSSKKDDENNSIMFKMGRNYFEGSRNYQVVVTQKAVKDDSSQPANIGNGPQTVTVKISQSGLSSSLTVFERFFKFDEYDAPTMDAKFHYGLNNTFGLSAAYRFEDSRFTLGLYAAMCKNRISQIEWDELFKTTVTTTSGSSSSSVTIGTNIIVEDGVQVTVEKYKETTHITSPDKRGYSAAVDPNGEAEHKKVYSYVMAMPGIHVNDWLHVDLGLGFARSQDTYWMADAYTLQTKEISYVKDNTPVEVVEQSVGERTGKSFLYKDKAKFNFAARPGINFHIPLDSYDEHYLKIGAGYTFVPGDKDANNLDFSVGYAFQF